MERVFIFDLGKVLIDWDPRHLYRQHFQCPAEMEHFLTEVCPPTWNQRMDAGWPQAEAIAEATTRHPDYARQIQLWASHWPEMMGGAIEGTVEILKNLKTKHRVLALTNWSHETYPHALARFDFLSLFEDTIISGKEKLIKPDPALYQRLLDRNDLRAEQCWFTDDSSANIRVAEEMGFHCHLFTTPEHLKSWLKDEGFL